METLFWFCIALPFLIGIAADDDLTRGGKKERDTENGRFTSEETV